MKSIFAQLEMKTLRFKYVLANTYIGKSRFITSNDKTLAGKHVEVDHSVL